MRISDWSSDVCSSDLRTPELRASLPVPGSDAGQLQRDEENGKIVATLLCLLSFSSLHCCSWRHVHRCKSWCARESRQEGIRDDQGTEIRAIGTPSRRVPIFFVAPLERKNLLSSLRKASLSVERQGTHQLFFTR